MPIHHILVPVDLSPPSMDALRVALARAREQPGCQVTVLHVASEAARDGAELRRAVDSVRPGEVPIRTVVRPGDPAQVILALAREESADEIVLATRSRHAAADYLLGSVALRVIGLAACPVVTIGPAAAAHAH